jgi:hypothetical protein
LHSIEFLKHLLRVAGRRLLVIWDGSPIHRRAEVTEFVASTRGKVWLEALPGYAPDLLTAAQRRLPSEDLQTSLGEAGTHQVRFLPKATDSKVELLVQLFQVVAHHVAHFHIFEPVPASFVPRVY